MPIKKPSVLAPSWESRLRREYTCCGTSKSRVTHKWGYCLASIHRQKGTRRGRHSSHRESEPKPDFSLIPAPYFEIVPAFRHTSSRRIIESDWNVLEFSGTGTLGLMGTCARFLSFCFVRKAAFRRVIERVAVRRQVPDLIWPPPRLHSASA